MTVLALVPQAEHRELRRLCAACGGPVRPEEERARKGRKAIEARAEARAREDFQDQAWEIAADMEALKGQVTFVLATAVALLKIAGEQRRSYDPPAERRALGWLLSGRARSSDFAGMRAFDFSTRAHRWLFAVGVELLEGRERGELPPACAPTRDTLQRAADLSGEDLGGAISALPWPAACPQLEVELVSALGRHWR